MTSAPQSTAPSQSPIENMPYDIMHEIFHHYMPEHTFAVPNTHQALFVLCQVSHSWRTVALTSPTLWSHLRYKLRIQKCKTAPEYLILKKDLAFLSWWRGNHGDLILPSLAFDFEEKQPWEMSPMRFEAGEIGWEFVLEYLASAKCLKLTPFFWKLIQERQIPCSNLQMLAMSVVGEDAFELYAAQSAMILGQLGSHTGTAPALKHLAINEGRLAMDNLAPHIWSSLTHISMICVTISLKFWFSLIHAAPNLEWGFFMFDAVLTDVEHLTMSKATLCTLRGLSTLYVLAMDDADISTLFAGLHLPALRTLSLNSGSESWQDGRAMPQLHTILKCTPNITTLALCADFLSLGDADLAQGYMWHTHDRGRTGIEPIWTYAPRLEHLQLELPFNKYRACDAGDTLMYFTREILDSEEDDPELWLALGKRACPIKSLTIIFEQLDWVKDDADWADIRQTQKDNAPNLDLRFEMASMEFLASEDWMDWCSRLNI